MDQPAVESLRLDEYCRRSSRGSGSQSLEAWTALVSGGLPLVEPIPGDRERLRVTFAWRPEHRVSSPSVYTPVADPVNGETQLQPLGETGVWYRTLVLPRRTRAIYAFSPRSQPGLTDRGAWDEYFRSLVADPHNPARITMAQDPEDPKDVAQSVSVFALPGAPPQPWSRIRSPSRWTVDRVRLRSRHVGGSRWVWVFTPPGFDPHGTRYNLIVGLDGVTYQSIIPAPRIVEYLVDNDRIGPSVLVLIGNALGGREAELSHNPRFVRFLAAELVPWLRRCYHLSFQPGRTVVVGSSLGGLTAAYAAFRHPKVFGNVLAQSGAFSWSEPGDMLGPPTMMKEYARAPRRRTKFYLDAGTFERAVLPGTHMSLLAGVRHLRDVLVAKGYAVEYAEFEGGHDYSCWAGTLADGLQSLIGNRKQGS